MEDKQAKNSELNVTQDSQSPTPPKRNRPRQSNSKMSQQVMDSNQSDQDEQYSDIERIRAKKKDKQIEQKAVQKLGINNLDDLMELFEDDEREKFLDMFRVNKVLGSGGFGVVLSVKDLQCNKNVALKIVYKKDQKAEMLRDEYDILKELQHENVIKIYRLINFQNFLMISMKLTKDNLSDFASRRRKQGQPLTEEECAQIMQGIFKGVAYLHNEKDIIHRDLKPPNIVVHSYNDLGKCKLIDFGIATYNRKESLRKYGNIGTLIYQPPEQVMNKFNYGKMSDIWALGIVTYTILTGKHPFVVSDDATEEVKDKIMKFKEFKFPSTMSDLAKHFISKLCTHEQSHRYSASEALKHPWITRDLNSKPPLTKQEKSNQLGEQLMIEDKLRKVQSVIYFLSVSKLQNAKNQQSAPLIDQRYLFKLRTQDNVLDVSPNKSNKMRQSSLQRRITVPKIDVQKTSSLARKDRLKEKDRENERSSIIAKQGTHGDESSNSSMKDYMEYTKNGQIELLSPDVKEFLRKNRIKAGRDDSKSGRSSKRSNASKNNTQNNFHANSRKSTINENSQLLSVPEKKRKKTFSSSSGQGHHISGDRSASLSPSSPMELRMNVSGNFSDFMSSDDESQKDGSSSSLIKNHKVKHFNYGTNQSKKTIINSSNNNKLPEIEENKSIQAKNQQPKEILQKIKQQRVEVKEGKHSNKFGGGISSGQNTSQTFYDSKTNSLSQNQKRKLSKPPSFQETLESQKTGSLIQMMHEQIKDEEEKRRAFGKSQVKQKSFKPGGQGNNYGVNQHRATSSYGTYQNSNQSDLFAGGVVNIEFLQGNNGKNQNIQNNLIQSQNKNKIPSPQRAQINLFKKMQNQ